MALIFTSIGVLIAGNSLVDPFWHLNGKVVADKRNYVINERISKTNLFLRRGPESYDCLIFGSSRTAPLDQRSVPENHCFNYAVSQATIKDYLAFSEYAKEKGAKPKTVIVGVDSFNFAKYLRPPNHRIPEFIKNHSRPTPYPFVYTSFDSSKISWKSFRGQTPYPRYYKYDDGDYICDFDPKEHRYRPGRSVRPLPKKRKRTRWQQFPPGPFTAYPVKKYRRLTKRWEDATYIGYIPPISAHLMARLELWGTLESYVETMHQTAKTFDRFCDFSLVSAVTKDYAETYDGSHFSRRVNDKVAAGLGSDACGFGVNVRDIELEDYMKMHQNGTRAFIKAKRLYLKKRKIGRK